MEFVISKKRFLGVFDDEVISIGQKLMVISETKDTYELDDGDGGTYNLPKNTMDGPYKY